MRRLVLGVSAVALAMAGQVSSGQKGDFPKPADLPPQAGLPNPLVMRDGRKVTSPAMWRNERRPELLRLFQHYMYGQLPPKPTRFASKVERVDTTAFGGKATLSEVTLTVGPPEMPQIHLMLVTPNRRTTRVPVLLGLNYFGNHTLLRDKMVRLADNWMPERGEGVVANRSTEASRGTWAEIWRIEDVIDRGYALATFYNGDVDFDTPDQRGIQKFFPHADPADDCGTVGHSPARAAADPTYWAWGGTADKPDMDRFNPAFFHAFDDLIRRMRGSGMNVELILLNFYRPPYTDTTAWTPAREHLWLRYLTARYSAFENIFLWTIANEYETHPDGKYRLDYPPMWTGRKRPRVSSRPTIPIGILSRCIRSSPQVAPGKTHARRSIPLGGSANSSAQTRRWMCCRSRRVTWMTE
ncbi:MAG: hypothetical protein JWN14_4371 [Chthonomonadales bacterium]|nr:hypothetical protein [Chthonomonadales bacterium]